MGYYFPVQTKGIVLKQIMKNLNKLLPVLNIMLVLYIDIPVQTGYRSVASEETITLTFEERWKSQLNISG